MTTVRPTSRFGMLEIDDDGRVNRFAEKPQADGWASAGYFIIEPEIFDVIGDRDDCILERELMERLAAAGELASYRHDEFFTPWIPIVNTCS